MIYGLNQPTGTFVGGKSEGELRELVAAEEAKGNVAWIGSDYGSNMSGREEWMGYRLFVVERPLVAGPAEFRKRFKAAYAMERLGRLEDSHGVVHVRDSNEGDGPLCRPRQGPMDEPGMSYGGSWEPGDLTCHFCIEKLREREAAAEKEREDIEGELRGMDAVRGVVQGLARAAGGDV